MLYKDVCILLLRFEILPSFAHRTEGRQGTGRVSAGHVPTQSLESVADYRVQQCRWSEAESTAENKRVKIKEVRCTVALRVVREEREFVMIIID